MKKLILGINLLFMTALVSSSYASTSFLQILCNVQNPSEHEYMGYVWSVYVEQKGIEDKFELKVKKRPSLGSEELNSPQSYGLGEIAIDRETQVIQGGWDLNEHWLELKPVGENYQGVITLEEDFQYNILCLASN